MASFRQAPDGRWLDALLPGEWQQVEGGDQWVNMRLVQHVEIADVGRSYCVVVHMVGQRPAVLASPRSSSTTAEERRLVERAFRNWVEAGWGQPAPAVHEAPQPVGAELV
jgi:hypothetical protein